MPIQINNKIHQRGMFVKVEIPAAGNIYPGMLVQQNATGVVAHSTAGGFAEKMFAQEDALQGATTQGFPDRQTGTYSPYSVAGQGGLGPDPVPIAIESPGSLTLALLKAGTHYTIGMKVISDGAGRMEASTGSPVADIGVITVDIDLSGSGAVDTLSQIRVL
jgi:hypothetical protein